MRAFTVELHPTVGFTDQLNQFFILYTLGRQVGLDFIPADVVSSRNAGDMWRELNLNQFFVSSETIQDLSARQRVNIDIRASRNDKRYSNISDMLADLRAAIAGHPNDAIMVFRLASDRNVFLHLFGTLPASAFEGLRRRFDRALTHSGFRSPFSSKAKLRVLIHIRKGDTAQIETPWEGDLALWHDRASLAVNRRPDEVATLRAVARRLAVEFASKSVEIVVFSDGYKRAGSLIDTALADSFVFPDERREFLHALLVEKEAELGLFATLPNTQYFGGEGHVEFQQLLIGLQEADVIISNGAQRLPAKVLGLLPTRRSKRRLVVLGADARGHHHYTDCILNPTGCEFVPLPWGEFSIRPVLDTCHASIRERAVNIDESAEHSSGEETLGRKQPVADITKRYEEERLALMRNGPRVTQIFGRLQEALAEISELEKVMPEDPTLASQRTGIISWLEWLERPR